MSAPIRVYLVDDHPIVRAGARLAIAGLPGFEVCGETGTPAGAPAAAHDAKADIVILDLLLGVAGDGLELVAAMHAAVPRARLLVFSMNTEDLFAERSLRAGAHGYLMKGGDLTELQNALRCVASGEVYLSRALSARRAAGRRLGPGTGGPLASLSDREMQVFLLLGGGKSSQEIARELGVSMKTVSAHRENVKVKLGIDSAAELIRHAVTYVVGQGQPH